MKKILFNTLFVLFSATILTSVPVQAARDMDQAIPPAPQIKLGKLPNGLTYYILKNGKPANKAELRLVVRAGSILEDDDQQGLAHFTEHMAFNGSTHFRKNELISFLQSIGVKFGADLNAYTSFDETVYILPIPTDRKNNLDKGMEVLQDWAGGLSFDDKEIDRERGVVLEESRLGKGAEDRMNKLLWPKIFAGSKYAERLPIGKDEIIANFPHAALRRFYADWYRPDLMAVIVVGDVDPIVAERMIKRHFSKLKNPRHERARNYASIPARSSQESVVASDREATNDILNITYSQSKDPGERTFGDYRQKIVQNLFNAMLGQRLQELTQSANAPYVVGGSGVGPLVHGYQQFSSVALIGKSGPTPAINALIQENQRAAQFGFTDNELARAKKATLRNLEQAYNERDKTESASYAAEFIRNFLVQESIPGIANEFAYAKEFLPTISLDEVNRFATKTIIGNDKKLITYQGVEREGVARPTPAALLAAVEAAGHNKVVAYDEKAVAASLMDKAPQGGTIASEAFNSALGLTELVLGNGVKVVLKPTDFKSDQVLMGATRNGGDSLYGDQDFISARYAASVVGAMGIGAFSPNDLQKILAGKSAYAAPFLGDIREGFNGQSGSADVETMLQMTYLYFTQPRKDSVLFRSWVGKFQDVFKSSLSRPETQYQDDMLKTLYADHPRGPRVPKPADFDKVSLERSLAIYNERFSSVKGYTFFFVGSFDLEKIKPLIAAYLGSLPTTEIPTAFKDVGLRTVKGVIKKEEHLGLEQKSTISIVFSGDASYSPEAQMRLAALLEVLNIKFTDSLREAMGAVYGANAGGGIAKDPHGSYSISLTIPCSPDNVDKLIAAALAEIDKLKANGAQLSDLNKVKENWIKSYREGLKTNGFWLSNLRSSVELGLDPARILSYESRVKALTPADVKAAANLYFDMHNYVQDVLYPAKKL